jgi:hypothetical protein
VAAQRQAKANDVSAANSQKIAEAGLLDKQQQTNAQATDQMTARSKQAIKDAGTLDSIFADSGLTGNTQARLQAEVSGNAAADETTIERNREAGINQSEYQADAIRANAQNQENRTPRPSVLGTGLMIVGAGVNAMRKPGAGN